MTTINQPLRIPSLPAALCGVLAFDALGFAVAVGSGMEDAGTAVVNGTPINAPLPFVCVQVLLTFAALRHRFAAAVLALLCAVSVFSGVADGSYAESLTAGERAIQIGIVAATVLLGVLAAGRARRQVG
jgi:hypothetical protein